MAVRPAGPRRDPEGSGRRGAPLFPGRRAVPAGSRPAGPAPASVLELGDAGGAHGGAFPRTARGPLSRARPLLRAGGGPCGGDETRPSAGWGRGPRDVRLRVCPALGSECAAGGGGRGARLARATRCLPSSRPRGCEEGEEVPRGRLGPAREGLGPATASRSGLWALPERWVRPAVESADRSSPRCGRLLREAGRVKRPARAGVRVPVGAARAEEGSCFRGWGEGSRRSPRVAGAEAGQ